MRRGFLGSVAALAAGAGAAWGQEPVPVAPAGPPPGVSRVGGGVVPAQAGPAPTLMPPVTVGPAGDPLGLGPTATLGPPPGPMYPTPGPYAAPLFQPPPPGQGGGFGYGAAPHVWFDGSYVLGFVRNQEINFPLLTTGSPNQQGVLGQPTTLALIPARDINYGAVSGFRLGGGFYGDADRRFGFDLTSLSLLERRVTQTVRGDSAGSTGIPVLARPFIDANTGAPASQVLVSPSVPGAVLQNPPIPGNFPVFIGTFPNFIFIGDVLTTDGTNNPTVVPGVTSGLTSPIVGGASFLTSTSVFAIDPSGVWNVFRSAPGARTWGSLDVLAGYRYLEVREKLQLSSTATLTGVQFVQTNFDPVSVFASPSFLAGRSLTLPIPVAVGGVAATVPATIQVTDRFIATNSFNGGNFGLRGELRRGVFDITATGRVAVGNMHQELRVRGVTAFSGSGLRVTGVQDFAGRPAASFSAPYGVNGYALSGVYANASNIGTFTRDEFTVIPEGTVNVGVNVVRGLRAYVGYSFLYVENVIRPGSELNPVINPAVIPFNTAYGTNVGTAGPGPAFNQTSYWVHAVNFGLQFRY